MGRVNIKMPTNPNDEKLAHRKARLRGRGYSHRQLRFWWATQSLATSLVCSLPLLALQRCGSIYFLRLLTLCMGSLTHIAHSHTYMEHLKFMNMCSYWKCVYGKNCVWCHHWKHALNVIWKDANGKFSLRRNCNRYRSLSPITLVKAYEKYRNTTNYCILQYLYKIYMRLAGWSLSFWETHF